MKKLQCAMALIMALLVLGCSNSDDTETGETNYAQLILGTWELEEFYQDGKKQTLSECRQMDNVRFTDKNEVFFNEFRLGASGCDGPGPQQEGRPYVINKNKIEVIYGGGLRETITITSITDTRMEWTGIGDESEVGDEKGLPFRSVYKKL